MSAGSISKAIAAGLARLGRVQITGGPTSDALGLGTTVTAYGTLRTTAEPTGLFNDAFDGATIDTANRWNTPVVSGFTVGQTTGSLTITTNTTASNSGFIDTQPTFAPVGVSFLAFGCSVSFENQSSNLFALNQHRFFGLGNRPGAYAAATPLNDAIGFEIGTDGILYASVWSAGVSKFRSATTLTGVSLNSLIVNGQSTRFGIGIRADSIIFYVSTLEYPAAIFQVSTSGFALPVTQSLPLRLAAINAPSGTVGASSFAVSTFGIGDTGGNSISIKDPTYAWRGASVSSAGALSVSELDTELNLFQGMTTYRERVIAQRYTVLSDSIADGLATFWTSTVANGGTNTVSVGEGLIQTSTATNGSAQLVSTAPAYYPGQSAWLLTAARFGDTGSTGNTRRIGVFTVSGTTPQDGFYFELADTTLNAVTCKAGTPTAVAVASWSRATVAPFTLDVNYHLFEIRWTANRADFYIDSVLRHTASTISTSITGTLNFPMAIQSINTSGATNRLIAVRNIGIGRFGAPDSVKVTGVAVPGTNASIAAAGTGTIGPVAVDAAGNCTFIVKNTVAASAYAGSPVLVFEQSDDNVSWGPLSVTRSDTGAAASTFTLAANSANASLMFDAAMEGVNWVRVRVTTGPTTNAMTVVIQPGGMPFSPIVSIMPQPLVKATQGVGGITTQDLKDAGRSARTITLDSFAVAATAETLMTMSYSSDNATLTTGTSYSVTSGKRLRLQQITLALHTITGNTTAAAVIVRIRVNNSGAGIVTSPVQAIYVLPGQAGVNAASTLTIPIPDGWEFVAGAGIAVTTACAGFVTTTAAPKVDITITGYEY